MERGTANPEAIARTLGADELVQDQIERYRTERASWHARLDRHHGPSIDQLLNTPLGPAEPTRPPSTRWLPHQPQPPPSEPQLIDDRALQLVLTVLGGDILRTTTWT